MRKYTHIIALSIITILGACGSGSPTSKKLSTQTTKPSISSQDTNFVSYHDSTVEQINSGKPSITDKKSGK